MFSNNTRMMVDYRPPIHRSAGITGSPLPPSWRSAARAGPAGPSLSVSEAADLASRQWQAPKAVPGPAHLDKTTGRRYRTSNPVTARPMIIRWISDVPSKIVKILAVTGRVIGIPVRPPTGP